MTDTLAKTADKLLVEIPPLRLPKLRPKFDVYHYIEGKKNSPTIAQRVPTLEDAVRIAWALADARPGEGHVGVWARTLHPFRKYRSKESQIVAIVSCDAERRRETFQQLVESGERSLGKWAHEFAESEQRRVWLERFGGFGSIRVSALWLDDEFRRLTFQCKYVEAEARAVEVERQVAA
jgi:hypothetical protein